MASIQELKDVLETQQSQAVELSQQAIAAIGGITSLASWTIGVLALVIAGIAIFGFWSIRGAAKTAAENIATTRLESYIKSQEFLDAMVLAVREEVRDRVKDKIIVANLTEEAGGDEPDPFPPIGGAT